MKDIIGDNVKEVLQNKENKFIYFYRRSRLDLEEFNKVSEFAAKIENGMRVVPYKIDLDKVECKKHSFWENKTTPENKIIITKVLIT